MRLNKPAHIIGLIFSVFLIIGIVFLGVGVYESYSIYTFKAHGISSAATVLSASPSDGTYVQYSVDGGEYTSRLGYYTSSMRPGQSIEIWYNAANPHDIRTGMSVFALVMYILGGVFGVVGATALSVLLVRSRRRRALLQDGEKITADITSIYRDTSIRINGRCPWRIEAQYIDEVTHTLYLYKSEALPFDPSGVMPLKSVNVFIDRNDPKKYAMDTSTLLGTYRVEDLR